MTTLTGKKIGQNRGKSRLWLEGKKLDTIGFSAGVRYRIKYTPQYMKFIIDAEGDKTVAGKKTDTDYRMPILDVLTDELGEWLNGCTVVSVALAQGQILVKRES